MALMMLDKDADSEVPEPQVELFASAFDSCLVPGLSRSERRARVLALPRKFYDDAVQRLRNVQLKRTRQASDDVDMDVDENDAAKSEPKEPDKVKQLELEIQTWDLVHRILPLRFPQTTSPKSSHTSSGEVPSGDDLESNPVFLERRAVLQWLHNSATMFRPDIDHMARDLQQNADRGDIIAHGWLHTRSKIKLRKSVTSWPHLLDRQSPSISTSHTTSAGAPLVTQLDPDASTRQGRRVEPQDEYFERAIWLGCFEHLRRGSNLETLREWCAERTEMWRAVSMSGLLLPIDGNGTEILADSRPASVVLWRRMCLALARDGGSDDYERAVYGLLSGDVSSVEKVARTWDDFLFANINALLRTQIDKHLLSKCPAHTVSSLAQSFPSFDATQFLGGVEGVQKRLAAMLEHQKTTREEALEPNKALQTAIITGDIDRHLYEQAGLLTECANKLRPSLLLPLKYTTLWKSSTDRAPVDRRKYFGPTQHDGLRIACHVYVVTSLLRDLDAADRSPMPSHWRSGVESIVAAYTQFLSRANLNELIPLYCTILQSPRLEEILSWNMIHEETDDGRMILLKLIKRYGIDTRKFVEAMAKLAFGRLDESEGILLLKGSFSILEEGPPTARHGRRIRPDFIGDDEAVVSTEHEHVIRSLEWLLQVQAAWPEVLRIGVQAYKFFLRNTHMLAARKLMERVQLNAVMQNVSSQEVEIETMDDVDFWIEQLEHGDISRTTPEQVMTDARNFRELENLALALDSLETIASLMRISDEYI